MTSQWRTLRFDPTEPNLPGAHPSAISLEVASTTGFLSQLSWVPGLVWLGTQPSPPRGGRVPRIWASAGTMTI